MTNRKLVRIDDYIDTYEEGDHLQFKVDDTIIFSNEQVYNELSYFYSNWGYLIRPSVEDAATKLHKLYTNYVASVGANYYRMYDALTREYNPLNNYEMIESGVDGKKISDKALQNKHDSLSGGKESDELETTNGTVQNDQYKNAFNSNTTSAGTHVGKDTTTNNNYKVTKSRASNEKETSTDGTVVLNNYDDVRREYTSDENIESYENDVDISYNKSLPSGESSRVNVGSDFTEGTMHEFTRSGNIGVTTSAQMINGELEMRKTNLFKDWVRGFIMRYCTYIGSDE